MAPKAIPQPPPKKSKGRATRAPILPPEWNVESQGTSVSVDDIVARIEGRIPDTSEQEGLLNQVFIKAPLTQESRLGQAVIQHVTEPEPPEDFDLSMLQRDELRDYLGELAKRAQESLKLFIPREEQRRFLDSTARERLVRGGNRGGKTLVGAVMCARCVTGKGPGRTPKRDGKFIVVGKDLKHCGAVIYEKLFKPGAFKIIKDPTTDTWRVYDPSLPWDFLNEDKAKMAPPLVPSRYVKSIAWEKKNDQIPKTIRFTTGWSLEFFSGEGAPRQGIVVDVAWFDEEIPHPLWYRETRARIIDRKGFFYWTATPQAGTLELYRLHVRAKQLRETPDPAVEEYVLSLLDNQYMDEKAKKEFIESINDEEEYRIRVEGDFALLGSRVYPSFAPKGAHGIVGFPIPHDWTRFVAIDPGRQFCAVLFAAVAPKGSQWYGRVIIYDELYIKKANAKIFAERLKAKIGLQRIRSFIIDHRAGRQHEMGSGVTVEAQYSKALKAVGVECEKTKHGFTWAMDDVKAGIEAVQSGLHIMENGESRLVFIRGAVPNLCKEMEEYSYRKDKGSGVTSDEPIKLNDHLCDCLRYLALSNLRYVKPRPTAKGSGYTNDILRKKRERAAAKKRELTGGSIILG